MTYTPAQPGTQAGNAIGAPAGKPRSIGVCILLAIVTLGIYSLVWTFKTYSELKRQTGSGLGGGLGLVLGIFVAPATYFVVPAEVRNAVQRGGQQSRVSAKTGFWLLLPLLGAIVWFVKVQGQLNDYWRSLGAS